MYCVRLFLCGVSGFSVFRYGFGLEFCIFWGEGGVWGDGGKKSRVGVRCFGVVFYDGYGVGLKFKVVKIFRSGI